MTLADLIRKHVGEHPALSRTTTTSYISIAAQFEQHLPKVAYTELGPSHLNHYKSSRIAAGIKPRTLNQELAVARLALSAAGVGYRFAGRVKKLPTSIEPGQALTPDQAALLLTVTRSKPAWADIADAVELALNTCMRKSEILTLKRNQVNLHQATVLLTSTKAKRPRAVPLNADALRVLSARLESAAPPSNAPLFQHSHLETAWRAVKKAASLELRFHDLRHTAISLLAMEGVPESVIREIAGHIDESMSRLYTHPHRADIRAAVNSLTKGDSSVHLPSANSNQPNGTLHPGSELAERSTEASSSRVPRHTKVSLRQQPLRNRSHSRQTPPTKAACPHCQDPDWIINGRCAACGKQEESR
ncbi:MAG: site-specific integrase [Acidobacteria bacterium]|nr:site-specific integrase [Acidobacteriota bacterium]